MTEQPGSEDPGMTDEAEGVENAGEQADDESGEQAAEPVADFDALHAAGELSDAVLAALDAERALVSEERARLLRAVAEAENQKKRIEREYSERARYASEGVLAELLMVFDSLEMALAQSDPGAGSDSRVGELHKGVELSLQQFLSALDNADVKPIEAEVGSPFDPKVHEALLRDDAANLPAQTIAKVMQRGFRFHDRILRPARVVVSTGKGHSA